MSRARARVMFVVGYKVHISELSFDRSVSVKTRAQNIDFEIYCSFQFSCTQVTELDLPVTPYLSLSEKSKISH